MGCADDNTNDATAWRHRDGSPVTTLELAQARGACRQTAMMRTERSPDPFATGNPAYHPGGIGLENTTPPGDFGFTSTLPNVPPPEFDDPARLEVCLESMGIVPASGG
jgi:hypothetical protein